MKDGLYSECEIETLEPQETYYENQERIAKAKERARRLDFFAAAALTGLLANPERKFGDRDEVALVAWIYAKTMLETEPKE